MALFNEDGTPYSPGGPAGPPAGGGGGGVAGPFTIDRSVVSGQELFDGVVLTTLTPGDLITDISWDLAPEFRGYDNPNLVPNIVYLGTSEVNILHTPSGNNLDNPTDDLPSSRFDITYNDTYVAVGAWLIPNRNVPLSIVSNVGDDGNWTAWNAGIWVPDTAELDLIVKIKDQDLGNNDNKVVDTSDSGVVNFYIHTSRLS
jgi:hypothetical protein